MTFDAETIIEAIREERAISRKKGFLPKSRLDKFSFEILELRKNGARPVEIQHWLRQQRIKVALSTVTRWLTKHE